MSQVSLSLLLRRNAKSRIRDAQECIKVDFFDKIWHAKSVGFRFYFAIWRSESRISSRYLQITSISLIYSLTFSRKKELLFWLSRGLNRITCQIGGDSKLRDSPIALLRPKVVWVWKIVMKWCTSFGTRLGVQVRDFSACFGYFTKWDGTTSWYLEITLSLVFTLLEE